TSAVVVGPVVARLGERRTLLAGLLLGAIGFVIFGWARQTWLFLLAIPINCLWGLAGPPSQSMMTQRVSPSEQGELQGAAGAVLEHAPLTVTAATSPRSAGGPHDYFSEADYWWPDPADPSGPFIQRDGMSNPDNFDDHRQAMRRLSMDVPALVAAWKLTGEARYAEQAVRHLRAWFVDEATRMSPDLRYMVPYIRDKKSWPKPPT